METNDPAYEWEYSKENVQPLKTGRKLDNLKAALQPGSTDSAVKIREEKQRFEQELRTYSGDDPQSVWYNYILWVEQNYPTGGRSQLSQLLEQCMAQYKDDERYKNDTRFLQLWVKFAQLCTDPREIYSFMFNQGICSGLAAFYEAWASELESVGNTKRADAVYQQGIDRRAKPLDWLQLRHKDFQVRVSARLANSETIMDVGQEDAENRVSLAGLKGHGKSKKVGSVRTPSSKPIILGVSNGQKPTSNVQGPGFTIFQDQENNSSLLPPETKQWAKVPIQSEINRENQMKAGRWTDAKVRQHANFSTLASTPSFKVHEDENVSQPDVTPRKVNPETNNKVLSARKQKPAHDPLQALTSMAGDTKQKVMYCKHLVYAGAEEFSIEEIRAAHLMKKEELRRKKQQEEEQRLMEEELVRQREELASVMQQKLQLEQEIQEQKQKGLMKMDVSDIAAVALPYPGSAVDNEQDSYTSDSMNTQRLLAYQVSSGSLQEMASNSITEKSLTNRQTPDSSSVHVRGTPQSGGLTQPSPTVNTKDAMRLVMGLFNQTMPSWDRNTSVQATATTAKPAVPTPFSIYTDDENQPPTVCQPDDDDEDAENRPPSGYQNGVRRPFLAGILQPSTDIPYGEDPKLTGDNAEMDDDGEILARPLQPDETEPMDCMDGGVDFGDLTFAPGCSSTRNFTAMAKQLASTTQLSKTLAEMNSQKTPSKDGHVSSKGISASQGLGEQTSCNSTTSKTLTGTMEVTIERTRSDTFPRMSNLSAINECSDEDMKGAVGAATGEVSQLRTSTNPIMATTKSTLAQQRHVSNPKESASIREQSSLHKSSNSRRDTLASSMNQTCHEIDISNYVPAEDQVELLSQSVMVKPDNDPFDQELIQEFLSQLNQPIETYQEYHHQHCPLPVFKAKKQVELGEQTYNVEEKLGEGAYAKVYKIKSTKEQRNESQVAKVQSPACPWEFYISCEVHKRLKEVGKPMGDALMKIDKAFLYNDGSCFISEFAPYGSLLDIVNNERIAGKTIAEPLAVCLSIQILRILESLISVDIIHGDIKPDNFLFRGFSQIAEGSKAVPAEPCLQLIDFGRGIDMRMFATGTTFTVGVETSGFQCVEMMTDRPWTYQTDMFGVIGTINVIVFGSYMKVVHANNRWKTNFQFKRWFKAKASMMSMFDTLLNVPSCSELPDINQLRCRLEDDFACHYANSYNLVAKEFMAKF